jgi:GAF domain-containing protein
MDNRTGQDGQQRVKTLRDYDILDSAPEPEFDAIVNAAAAAIGTPMALISLLDANRQWFMAKVGISASETPITSSFCAHAIRGSGVFAVSDATLDEQFAANPLVTGKPHIRFYAGAPLRLAGVRVGTLCVLDDQSRKSLTRLQEDYLLHLAERTTSALYTRNRR